MLMASCLLLTRLFGHVFGLRCCTDCRLTDGQAEEKKKRERYKLEYRITRILDHFYLQAIVAKDQRSRSWIEFRRSSNSLPLKSALHCHLAANNLKIRCRHTWVFPKFRETVILFSGEEAPIPSGCKPTFTERPTIRQLEEGKITFECRLVGEPRPDVSWYHNERKVEGRRHKVTLTEDESKMFYLVRLEISGVEAADAGTYKAVARNVTGEGHATINLTFEEGE